ncbi:MAG TPA: GspE/PulE family protein [Patescibacteria group bacterium]|nr:GspE/PulE family protein [Patescibacteria group bacterium]
MLNPIDRSVRIKQVYSELDRKFEEEETQRRAKDLKLAYINLYGFPIDAAALALVPKIQAEQLGVVVFYKEGRNLKIGMLEPSSAIATLVSDFKKQSYFMEVYLISDSSFKRAMESYSKVIHVERKSSEIKLAATGKVQIESLKDLSEKLQGVSVTEMMEALLSAGLSINASDIHIEPEQQGLKIRFRLDGVLQDVAILPKEQHHQLVSRIKILSKLKLNITNTPQDGSFSLTSGGTHVDIRVSVLPSAYGESIVMRILRQDKGSLKFEDLGITGSASEKLLSEMQKPNGMILTTGPTGSGKTTTLYAILNKLNEPGVKIITIEDPVEYKIDGITQTPVGASTGLTFADALRSILRQDPDIVMVGEMRDLETAETASQAALTGHIVLSTLHTNDAPSAIPRLLDLGVKPFVLAPAVNAIIAQRLVRRLCPHCKTTYEPNARAVAHVQMILKAIPAAAKVKVPKDLSFYHSPGCPECNGLGYKGRIGVYEIFTVNDAIESLIHKEATTSDVRNQAISDGMLTMAQDGILKTLQGITDIEEVFRVTEE